MDRRKPKPGDDRALAKQFAYEMAFDPRFEGRAWDEVEPELRTEYPGWQERHARGPGGANWERVKRAVQEAWESALDVERAQVDPWTGQWDERALEYRRMWERRYGVAGGRWEDAEAGYRYADAMALDPQYIGRPWDDVAPGLEAGFRTWAASHGYRIREGENLWERLRHTIRDAWDHVKHRRSA